MAERLTLKDRTDAANGQSALEVTQVQTSMKLQVSGQASSRKRGLTAGLISTIEDPDSELDQVGSRWTNDQSVWYLFKKKLLLARVIKLTAQRELNWVELLK